MGRISCAVAFLIVSVSLAGETTTSYLSDAERLPATGRARERRFPPLVVPSGFKTTLFACDPLVEFPSVIAIGPELGTLFVAHDYMTGLGFEIVRRDEIRILRDIDGDGDADESQLFAKGFNSIQGLAYHDGSVFAMHAPQLTLLRDTDADGIADFRRDLIDGLGLPPEENPNRLHCANGIVVGHDGWMYLALGDHGCDVKRPEGDRLLFQEGGILRCRPDGSDLHVFATGLRNIYDIALDADLNVFVRDNENDGGDYMIRVCHSFHGADHGYPYLYRERPAEAMRPLADLGRGSSAGGTAYLETAFPSEYRRSLFFCEWGRAVVRYEKLASHGHFKSMTETDFAAGAPADPYGFKPTDLVVDYDGSLLISDWCDGQRPKRGRGRIYRITAVGGAPDKFRHVTSKPSDDELMKMLNSASYHQRLAAQTSLTYRIGLKGNEASQLLQLVQASLKNGSMSPFARMHGIWIVARTGEASTIDFLLNVARNDPHHRVRVQAIRAIADLSDPDLVQHRLAAGRGDQQLASRIAGLAETAEPRVVLEILVTLGRLRWSDAPTWLARHWKGGSAAHAHAAMQLLRRADNWPTVLSLLDRPKDPLSRSMDIGTIALQAVGDRAESTIVDGIIKRLNEESDPDRRSQYVDLLARVYKRPAPWEYWGFRPPPRPANVVAWECTAAIEDALRGALEDSDPSVRITAVTRMRRENIPVPFETLADWLWIEQKAGNVSAILEALSGYPMEKARPLLLKVVRSSLRDKRNRLEAFERYERGIDADNESELLDLALNVEDGPVLATVLEAIGNRPKVSGNPLLLDKLTSDAPEVRAAALRALGKRKVSDAIPHVLSSLHDDDPQVLRAAAAVAGLLKVTDAAPSLLKTAASNDPPLRRASLVSLRQLKMPGAVSLAIESLQQPDTQLAALNYLGEFGTPRQLESVTNVAMTNRSIQVLVTAVQVLTRWLENRQFSLADRQRIQTALAQIHGNSGVPISWSTVGPLEGAEAQKALDALTGAKADLSDTVNLIGWRRTLASGIDSAVQLPSANKPASDNVWFAMCQLFAESPAQAQFFASADGVLQVWLNRDAIFERKHNNSFRPNSDQFEGSLIEGTNRLLLKLTSDAKTPRMHVHFRTKASVQEHERLTKLLLASHGNVKRGKELFANAEKSGCIKCHRIGDKGGRVGPDLTGIGSRFSRIHLIESILQPSRTIAPSYSSMVVVLDSGKVLSGVKMAETPGTITLGDKEGESQMILRSEIEQSRVDEVSTMPEGLEKRMTDRELTDLIEFLSSQKKPGTN